jgi:hypothetical protein
LLAPPLFADAGQRLIPAGSLVSCTTGDARISSKTTAVGDPVLCKVEHKRGDFMLPYGSYLGGEFAEYKDPGHFVGKGWMELSFDRLYVGDTVVPINAKVVDVPGYKIDAQGRILGKGHAVRDTILWMIPVLWPIDLLELPRRGPRPTLKQETALTLRVMDDLQVPVAPEPQRDPYGLYQRGSNSDAPQPAPPVQQPEPEQQNAYVPEQPAPVEQPAPPVMAYAPPVIVAPYVAPVVVAPYPVAMGYSVVIVPRVGVVYAPRAYMSLPMVRPYAPRVYAYGYTGPGFAGGGYAARAGFVYPGARMR